MARREDLLACYCSRQHQVNDRKSGYAANCCKIQSSSTTVATVNGLTENQNSSELVNGHGSQIDSWVKSASTSLWPEFEEVDDDSDDSDSEDCHEKVDTNIIKHEQGKDGEFLKQFINMEASKDKNTLGILSRAHCRASKPSYERHVGVILFAT